uniref:Metallo-beta-lactamase domain-containing protein n=1 Tax=Eubacterium plexicaudatum ASF492 TaxID=1235802 RepID=N2A3H7_9FIRM
MKIVVLIEDTGIENTGMEDIFTNPSCCFEHGLSLYVETKKHKLLVDTGATDAFIKNAEKLNIDLTGVDTVIISHGHYDHTGGIPAFHELNPKAQIYMQRSACGDFYHGERYIGMDPAIAELDCVHMLDGDCRIDEELFLFTKITGRKYFAKSNLLLSKKVNGQHAPDTFEHEQCLVITQGEEHTVISGCAHNGILNILSKYQEWYDKPPKTVISGFHMMKKGAYEQVEAQIICETAAQLCTEELSDTVFYTGHCTGEQAFALMKPYMGDRLRKIHSGMQIF